MPQLTKAIARLMEEKGRPKPSAAEAPSESHDPPRLRDILDLVRSRVSPGERPQAETVTRQLLERDHPELLTSDGVAELAGLAFTLFRTLQEPGRTEPRLHLQGPGDEDFAGRGFALQIWMRERPFLLDTVDEVLRETGCVVRRRLQPVFTLERDERGSLLAVSSTGDFGRREIVLHLETENLPDPDALTARLEARLRALVAATDDYAAMRQKAEEMAAGLRTNSLSAPWGEEAEETAAFLDWLGDRHFVFLGYREYDFRGGGAERTVSVRSGSGLGILRDEDRSRARQPVPLSPEVRRRLHELPLLVCTKTRASSPVLRSARMDYLGLKEVDATGVVVGERRLLGLFTSRAWAEDPGSLPLLRRKLESILAAEEAEEGSRAHEQIVTAFRRLPRLELLAMGAAELREVIDLVTGPLEDLAVAQHPDASGQGAFVTVIVPRERFSQDLAAQVETRLAELLGAGLVLERHVTIEDDDRARMHFCFLPESGALRPRPAEELGTELIVLLQTWDDRLREALQESLPRQEARELARSYAGAVSAPYKAATPVSMAVRDITCLEALSETRTAQIDLVNPPLAEGAGSDPRFTAVKLYLAGEELIWSDFLPVLENLGLRVFSGDAVDVSLPDLDPVRIHRFLVQDRRGARLDATAAAPLLIPALALLFRGRIENDRLNELLLGAGLDWRQIDLLRAYANHAVQIGSAPNRETVLAALVDNPGAARALWDYFEARFDPRQPLPPRERLTTSLPPLEKACLAAFDAVPGTVPDRILRRLFRTIQATVRTNYFRGVVHADTAVPVSFKLDDRALPELPLPRPRHEIYVHAPEVEGVHLRGADVARGGLRLSDRADDFRTEILDLMTTQVVKNAVIVPAGAKGGFVVRRRPGVTPGATQVTAAYRTFIRALLEITDNLTQGRIEHPRDVLIHDEPDPYLVVAADKGTATFSDLANEIAAEHRFWLGDAFASGGSQGYDHKRQGITARGAWECVQRHFREMGRNLDRDTLSVVGIGDMSGDVFGNGLLLSRRFRLLAAFDHRHVFLDPDPDPARSFAERERLFRLPRSSWADYNPTLISEGGGVFPRDAKRIPLSPEARQLLGFDETEEASGEEVIRALLRLEVDLLWNGGIGTYVKASDESQLEVGDTTNDGVRVNGSELRARVVGEGGNLGFTQRGRIEYALHGGRINTDAIDNSGGVDMSDHEVNLKIGLAPAVESGELPREERNRLLAELEGEIVRRVLDHNRRQARALSLDQGRSQTRLEWFRDLMDGLEEAGALDRRQARLPDRQALRNRRGTFLGLTRPELAVLLGHAKLDLQHRLLSSDVPDEALFENRLRQYFPEIIERRFGRAVRAHRLRREIIAVELANQIIDTMGMTFVSRVAHDTARDEAMVVRAWNIVAAAAGAEEIWNGIMEADPPLPLEAERSGAMVYESALERATKWYLETQPLEAPAAEMVSALHGPLGQLLPTLPESLPEASREEFEARVSGLAAEGMPRALGESLARLEHLASLLQIAEIAAGGDTPLATVAEAFYRAGDLVDAAWLRQSFFALPRLDRWDRRATEELIASLQQSHQRITLALLACRDEADGAEDGAQACLDRFVANHAEVLRGLADLIHDIKGAPHVGLPALFVLTRQLARVAADSGGNP